MPTSLTNLLNTIVCGDARSVLKELPDESIDTVVTSPPYWGLRDYGHINQIGLEASYQTYLDSLLEVFDEVKRILKPTGSCWVNLGDSYFKENAGKPMPDTESNSNHSPGNLPNSEQVQNPAKRKCLAQIPARFALAMTERGWILRNEIIWWKPNCMPASVTDRFTVDFEKVFFFVKQRYYYFEQQHEPLKDPQRLNRPLISPNPENKQIYGNKYISTINPKTAESSRLKMLASGRNKRCVWYIGTSGFKDAHFAVFPEKLVETPIQAGCPIGGIVLDPFVGSGTTAIAAKRLNRQFIGIDISPVYVKMASKRLAQAAYETN